MRTKDEGEQRDEGKAERCSRRGQPCHHAPPRAPLPPVSSCCRDVKPNNVLLSGDAHVVKLVDLGIAKLMRDDLTRTIVGAAACWRLLACAGMRCSGHWPVRLCNSASDSLC